MENPQSENALPVRSESYEDVTIPGVVVECDALAAEDLGAFEETALTETEAWESNMDLPQEEAPHG